MGEALKRGFQIQAQTDYFSGFHFVIEVREWKSFFGVFFCVLFFFFFFELNQGRLMYRGIVDSWRSLFRPSAAGFGTYFRCCVRSPSGVSVGAWGLLCRMGGKPPARGCRLSSRPSCSCVCHCVCQQGWGINELLFN